MRFKSRNLREIADMVVGNVDYFPYRSSSYISEFFEDCDLPFVHDGSTRNYWAAERLSELLAEPQPTPNELPRSFMRVLRVLMLKSDAVDEDPDRALALAALNKPLGREGYEAFYSEDDVLYVKHVRTDAISGPPDPHRPLTKQEVDRWEQLERFLDTCSEDQLTSEILLPLFRHLGFRRITAAGHQDKTLEYGKDIWMKYVLPTLHVLYFGVQVKKGKLTASSAAGKGGSANMAEILNQVTMMLGHEVFDPESNRRVLVDHAIIVAGGEITKQAKNWLGGKLDALKRSQILFMDRKDILNLFVTRNIPLPGGAEPSSGLFDDELPF